MNTIINYKLQVLTKIVIIKMYIYIKIKKKITNQTET